MLDPEDQYGVVTARYYDATYEALGVVGSDVDFYRRLAHEAQGSILELGLARVGYCFRSRPTATAVSESTRRARCWMRCERRPMGTDRS